MKNKQSPLKAPKTNRLAKRKKIFIALQIILIIIQITILLTLLMPHGYVTGNKNALLNGYQMGKVAYPISAIILIIFSTLNIYLVRKKDEFVWLYMIQVFCMIVPHVFLLFFVFVDGFKLCIDVACEYTPIRTPASLITSYSYLAEFWLIITSIVFTRKIEKLTAQIESANNQDTQKVS